MENENRNSEGKYGYMIKSQPTSQQGTGTPSRLLHTDVRLSGTKTLSCHQDPALLFCLCYRSEPTESKMPFYTCVLPPACGARGTPGLGTFPPSDTQQGPWLWIQTASPAAITISKSKSRNSDSCLFQALCHGAVSPLAWQQPEVFGKVGRSSDGEGQ